MSLASKNVILASDFVSLKARVKAEMNRRCRSGSMTSYAGTSYDYSVTPASNGKILPEHLNKLTTPVNAISNCGIAEKQSGDVIPALDDFDAKLSSHEAFPIRGSGTDCASSCSGLCSSGCWNSCSGCGGSCSYSCSGGCDTGCSGCEGCGSGCSAGCAPTCAGGCWNDGCTSNCTAACRMDCTGGCGGGCGTSCRRGCSASCSPSCANGPGIN